MILFINFLGLKKLIKKLITFIIIIFLMSYDKILFDGCNDKNGLIAAVIKLYNSL